VSTLGDLFGFEKFQLGSWWKKIKKHPEQLFLGAAEPVGAKLWGGITGKKIEPLVDEWGGPTEQTFADADAAGINTAPAHTGHDIAHTVAAIYAGKYGMDKLGGGNQGGLSFPQLPEPQAPINNSSVDAYFERQRLKKALREAIAKQAAEAASMAPQPRLVT
jgi:hypothetical protein